MNTQQEHGLTERLSRMRAIRPDPATLKWTRRALLAEIAPQRRTFVEFMRAHLSPVFGGFTLASALGIALIAAFTPQTEPAHTVASLDRIDLETERATVTEQDLTPTARYMKGISPTISLALDDIIDPSTDYGSTNHIKKGLALLNANRR